MGFYQYQFFQIFENQNSIFDRSRFHLSILFYPLPILQKVRTQGSQPDMLFYKITNDLKIYIHQNTNIQTANKIPAKTKYIPFLNIVVLGKNIQKEEITKNSKDVPKNIFK